MNLENDFNPYILGIFCNWCSYAGADQAGTSRMQRPANLRILRVMCGGRVDPQLILDAFKKGVDGVLISHCYPGDCHYVEGNYKTIRKIPILQLYLKQFGINPKRLKFVFVSASEGFKLTNYIKEFVQVLRVLGSNPISLEG
ncbi:MAG: hydrogenase iron-sulfur subunit [Candidatus Lokiarchaeota archaeon]|nr:hydrogenase iron-sulfur subunit [Candidatus Lokiarchaeota archaeon]